MKVWKLISGISSFVFSSFFLLSECAFSCAYALSDSSDNLTGGYALFLGVALLIGGIESVIVSNKNTVPGNVTIIVVYVIALALSFITLAETKGNNPSLLWFLIVFEAACVALAIIDIILINNSIHKANNIFGGGVFRMSVIDDSMSPVINSGDVVLVQSQNTAQSGNTVVVMLNGQPAMIRDIYYSEDGSIELKPKNASYPIIKYEVNNRYSVKVVGIIKDVIKPSTT